MPLTLASGRLLERRSHHRETMTDTAAIVCLVCAPFVGYATSALVEPSDPVVQVIVGAIMLLLTGLLFPFVRWMMRKIDRQSLQDARHTEAREKREDRRLEAYERQVTALTALVGHMELLLDGHREVLARLDALPDKITDKLNGDEDEDGDA